MNYDCGVSVLTGAVIRSAEYRCFSLDLHRILSSNDQLCEIKIDFTGSCNKFTFGYKKHLPR